MTELAKSPYTEPIDLLKSAGVTQIAVANTDDAWSYSFLLKPRSAFGLELKGACDSGTLDIKVELEAGGTAPDTEGATDLDFTVPREIGGGANADCVLDSSLNTTLIRFYPIPFVVAPFQRIHFKGQNSNPATGKITRLLLHQIQQG